MRSSATLAVLAIILLSGCGGNYLTAEQREAKFLAYSTEHAEAGERCIDEASNMPDGSLSFQGFWECLRNEDEWLHRAHGYVFDDLTTYRYRMAAIYGQRYDQKLISYDEYLEDFARLDREIAAERNQRRAQYQAAEDARKRAAGQALQGFGQSLMMMSAPPAYAPARAPITCQQLGNFTRCY